MGNGKSEILETLEHWNIGKERKAQSVKRKEIAFVTSLSALHSKLNFTLYALRSTLYAGTLELYFRDVKWNGT